MKLPKLDDESNFPNLSSEELSEIRHLSVAYRTFMDIFLRSKFINMIFLCSIIVFFIFYIMKLADIRSPYGTPTSELNIMFLISISILTGIFLTIFYITKNYNFDTIKWLYKYIQLWSKSFQWAILLISVLTNLFILSVYIIVVQQSFFQGADISVLFLFSLYIIFLLTILIGPLYADSIKFHSEFILYIKNKIKNCKVYGDKIRAYRCLWLVYEVYIKELNGFFGKESVDVIKLNNLLILSEEILKLDLYNDDLNTKKNDLLIILSSLEKADPFHSTKNFIKEMDNIKSKFDNKDFFKKYEKKLLLKRKFPYNIKSKIYYILMSLSIIFGAIRLITLPA